MKVVLSTVLGLLALALVSLAPARAAAPPLSAFARLPAIEQAVISPDGSRVAMLGGTAQERIIFIAPVDGQGSVTIKLGVAWVRDIRWVGNAYLVVNLSALEKAGTLSGRDRYAYQVNRNIVLNLKGEMVAQLLSDTQWSALAINQPILGVLDGPKPLVIVQGLDLSADVYGYKPDSLIKPKGDSFIAALWAVDVTTGKGRLVERGNRFTQSWDLDAAGEPRVRWDYDGEADRTSLFARPKGKSGWDRIDRATSSGEELDFLGYSDPDDSIYLLSRDADGVQVLRRRLTDGVTTPVGPEKPAVDLSLQWNPYSIVPVAIVSEADRPTYQWLDGPLGVVHGKLSRTFPGRHVQFTGWSRDGTRIVVKVDGPDSPPAWYLFDTKTNQASSLGESYPELADAALGTTSWITYKARDGLEISAYLTLPPGLAEGARPPLIVMPHGGPAVRDSFEFDWWVQALATRGYAVLQPQFRGSSGFGAAFEKAGYREWGGKMQTDLIDGILALAAAGVIDRDRVGIVGASYGGYAALFGATVYPSAYRCAVSVNGASDLALLVGSKRRAYGDDTGLVNSLITMMGDPTNSPEALRVASPVFRVTSQAAPILLIHGQEDTVVPMQQSQTMQRALKAVGKPGDLVLLQGDDHHLSSSLSRLQMLTAMFAFLDGCLPVTP